VRGDFHLNPRGAKVEHRLVELDCEERSGVAETNEGLDGDWVLLALLALAAYIFRWRD
jgi:hypothetical protein